VTGIYDIGFDAADIIDLSAYMGNKFGGNAVMNYAVQYPLSLLKFDAQTMLKSSVTDPKYGTDYAYAIANKHLGDATTANDTLYKSHQDEMVQAAVAYVGQHLDAYEKADAARYDISGFRLGASAGDLLQRSAEGEMRKDAAITKLAREGAYHGPGFLPMHTGAPTTAVDPSGNITATSQGVDLKYTCKAEGSKLYWAQMRQSVDPNVVSTDDIKSQLVKKFGSPAMDVSDNEPAEYLVWGGMIPAVFFDPSVGVKFEALAVEIRRGSYTLTLNSPKLAAQADKCIETVKAASKREATSSLRF
jgi:hypothetical protein